MKKSKRILTTLVLAALALSALCVPALAITEAEVEAEVAASGKAAVAGNILIWFLCAVAFLKVSQKIDSFLSVLGVNVGHTGGSMLGEAMIAMRTVSMLVGGGRGAAAGRAGASFGSAAGRSGAAAGDTGFFKGGLAGMAGRHITDSAVKTATTRTAAVHTAQSQARQAAATGASAAQTATDTQINSEAHSGGASIHTENSTSVGAPPQDGVVITGRNSTVHAPRSSDTVSASPASSQAAGTGSGQHTQTHTERFARTASRERVQTGRFRAGAGGRPTLGGMVFSRSLAAGGSFANSVIGTVARGEVAGSITGDMAAQSLASYMGQPGGGIGSRDAPAYSDVEIGRGRITGTETSAGCSEGRPFAMYHAGQYAAPSGEYTKVTSADGTQWYKQYAQDAVERKPYVAPDDTVAYHERIIKKLPDPPKRKDRI